MRKGGSSAKGAGFERDVCVQLSLWITGGKKRDCFWRSAMSGGRATVAFARGERLDHQAGDICAISPEGHILTDNFYFECKFRREMDFHNFTFHRRGPLWQWWQDTLKKAKQHNREPVLIAKSNRVAPIIVTRPNCPLNPNPVAFIEGEECFSVGLLERTLKLEFSKIKISTRQFMFPSVEVCPSGLIDSETAKVMDYGTQTPRKAKQQHRSAWIRPRHPRTSD